jgi:hypothetical protein
MKLIKEMTLIELEKEIDNRLGIMAECKLEIVAYRLAIINKMRSMLGLSNDNY